jgi:hypothetical protein
MSKKASKTHTPIKKTKEQKITNLLYRIYDSGVKHKTRNLSEDYNTILMILEKESKS